MEKEIVHYSDYSMGDGGVSIHLARTPSISEKIGNRYTVEFQMGYHGASSASFAIDPFGLTPDLLRHMSATLAKMADIMDADPKLDTRWVNVRLPKNTCGTDTSGTAEESPSARLVELSETGEASE